MKTSLTARDAAEAVLASAKVQPALRMPLDDALGCILASDVTSPIDIPPWRNSAMDGYAVRADDVRGAGPETPLRLGVVEEVPAGAFPTRRVGPGEAVRIFTGAPLPEGADTVVRQEDTDRGRQVVTILSDRDAGANVRAAGEDVRRGDLVLTAGTAIGPAQVGVLASLAQSHPMVHRQPRVAILGGGDEIVDLDQPEEILAGRKIASSNTHTLVALVRLAGGVPVNLGIARDNPHSLREHLERAADCDLIVTSAGISVGEHDYVRTVLEAMGARMEFWRVRMRPGAPVGFGHLGDVPWVGLPGNPVSTMITFELFVRPAIRRMRGAALPFRRGTPVRLAQAVMIRPRLQHFLRVVLSDGPDGPEARLAGAQGSGILTSMVKANALLVVPEGQHETPVGATVTAIRFDETRHQEEPAF